MAAVRPASSLKGKASNSLRRLRIAPPPTANLDHPSPVGTEGDFAMHKRLRTVQILKKRTDTLRTLIRRSASEYQILKAALKLREARIRAVNAQIGEMPFVLTTPEQTRRVANLVKEIESLEATPPLDFVAEIRASLGSGA
jgi:hypothetical protein